MWNLRQIERLIALALEEDLPYGDVTSRIAIGEEVKADAEIVARERLVVCGLPILERIVAGYGGSASVILAASEGETVEAGARLAAVRGRAQELLALERTMLNFLQRLCGVATRTRRIVEQCAGVEILDTRKTTPGWRMLEKYAVRTGGARNHRYSLSDMILVKNNHVDACGGMKSVLTRIMRERPRYMPVEVEVRNMEELKEALPFNPDIIMLDNFSDELISQALAIVRQSGSGADIEISGGVTAERLPKLAAIGAQLISMGSLTTQATNADISMRIAVRR